MVVQFTLKTVYLFVYSFTITTTGLHENVKFCKYVCWYSLLYGVYIVEVVISDRRLTVQGVLDMI